MRTRTGTCTETQAARFPRLTGVKHWLVFSDDLCKQGFLPLLAHLRQVLLFDLSLLLLLLGGRVLTGIIVCIHLQKHNQR